MSLCRRFWPSGGLSAKGIEVGCARAPDVIAELRCRDDDERHGGLLQLSYAKTSGKVKASGEPEDDKILVLDD